MDVITFGACLIKAATCFINIQVSFSLHVISCKHVGHAPVATPKAGGRLPEHATSH